MAAKQKWRGDDRSFRGMRVSDSSLLTYVDDLRTCCSELANVRDGLSSGAVTPRFIPELIVAPFADASYAENKRYQVQLAGELWRVRRRIRALDEVCEEPPAPLPAPAPAIINWFTSTALAVSRDLPPPWEQRAVVREMALRAAVEALQATGASSAQGEARAPRDEADLTVLLSEEYSRAYDGGGATTVHGFTPVFTGIAPDDATYTCWLVVTQHALSRRIAAVLVALRKRRPPHLESLERLAFACIGSHVPLGASAETAEGMRLRVAVLEAFEAWRAPSTPPEPRRLLVARCESLAWPFELCKAALPLRPSCHAVLVQAGDAVVELAVAALLADSAPLRAHVGEALGRLHEALTRAAALHAHDGANVGEMEPLTWRHRLSTRLAFELSQRAELLALPMPAPLPLGEAARKLGSAAKQLIEGFGGAGRRAKAAEVVAVEAFAAASFGTAVEGTMATKATKATKAAAAAAAAGSAAASVSESQSESQSNAHDDAVAWGGGLLTLLRLHAHTRCSGAARRALGALLDYLLHLTPSTDFHRAPDLQPPSVDSRVAAATTSGAGGMISRGRTAHNVSKGVGLTNPLNVSRGRTAHNVALLKAMGSDDEFDELDALDWTTPRALHKVGGAPLNPIDECLQVRQLPLSASLSVPLSVPLNATESVPLIDLVTDRRVPAACRGRRRASCSPRLDSWSARHRRHGRRADGATHDGGAARAAAHHAQWLRMHAVLLQSRGALPDVPIWLPQNPGGLRGLRWLSGVGSGRMRTPSRRHRRGGGDATRGAARGPLVCAPRADAGCEGARRQREVGRASLMSTRDGTLERRHLEVGPPARPATGLGWLAGGSEGCACLLACLLARGEIHDLENGGMEYWEIEVSFGTVPTALPLPV